MEIDSRDPRTTKAAEQTLGKTDGGSLVDDQMEYLVLSIEVEVLETSILDLNAIKELICAHYDEKLLQYIIAGRICPGEEQDLELFTHTFPDILKNVKKIIITDAKLDGRRLTGPVPTSLIENLVARVVVYPYVLYSDGGCDEVLSEGLFFCFVE